MNKKELKILINNVARSLGFDKIRVADPDLSVYEEDFQNWIKNKFHGSMEYMESHGLKRVRPSEIMESVKSVVSLSINYLPENNGFIEAYSNPKIANISRYALGRDYHKVLKKKLKKVAEEIKKHNPNLEYRIFVDSAPVLERGFAEKSGIGWTGKNSLILDRENGSFFFLGEIFLNIELEPDEPVKDNCGKCTACKSICPTGAIIDDGLIDARRCISYLTIENKNEIPVEFRPLIGNKIYGCDDCQVICPVNINRKYSKEKDFLPREYIFNKPLIEIWNWTEDQFLKNTEGSAIRRIGYERWMRNVAVAIGNSGMTEPKIKLLKNKLGKISDIVDEHIEWAVGQNKNEENIFKVKGIDKIVSKYYQN